MHSSKKIQGGQVLKMDINEFVSLEEAAKISGYQKWHVGYLCREGKLAGVLKVGNSWLIPRASIENYKPGPQGFAAIWKRKREAQEQQDLQELQEAESENFDEIDMTDKNAVEAEKERLCKELMLMEEKNLEILRKIDLIRKKLLRLHKASH